MRITFWTNKHIVSTTKANISFCPGTIPHFLAKQGLLSRHFRKISTPAGIVEEEFHLEKLKMFGAASVKQLQLSSCFFHEYQASFGL
jgi:hypothetical protein